MSSIIVNLVQKTLSSFGVRLTRLPKCVEPIVPFDVLELALIREINDKNKEFYFVHISANKDVMNDSLGRLVRKYYLRGCVVEPMADVLEAPRHNYRDQTQLDFRKVMIGDWEGVAEIYRLKRDALVPHQSFHGLSSHDAGYIQKTTRPEGHESYKKLVKCRMVTFESLMADLPVRNISMLYIDTEGNGDKIIDSCFQGGIFPSIINYGWTEMSSERRCELKMRLLDHGYRFLDVGSDTVCLRVEHASPSS